MKNIWNKIALEAKNFANKEAIIERIIIKNINDKKDFWHAISDILGDKLKTDDFTRSELQKVIVKEIEEDPDLQEKIIADLKAYVDRDFAIETYLEVILFSRGFQGITAYRVARRFLLKNQKLTAKFFQNRIFEVYAIDIHPNAKLGQGIVIDHGIGLVIGETAEIGDNVFIFHNVTLGGTGHQGGDRHPKIKNNVFIGAGATILGNITINNGVNIAASSVVTKSVEEGMTVAGIPAKVIGKAKKIQ
ncbi:MULTISPECIES: serine O-acetyltransferase EpsC [Aquimarina]|uniref:Serine acetyltransferase n=1 Tax=Aquimarina algiphila TaxID=2047982 RepID=A0A554VAK2_9FLAO|nr:MULTISPECIES: serine O-acetyltransferase EpsC [Aquimarina]TSE03224.1 serine O-acetyltransferase [Aquimarina algiphila]